MTGRIVRDPTSDAELDAAIAGVDHDTAATLARRCYQESSSGWSRVLDLLATALHHGFTCDDIRENWPTIDAIGRDYLIQAATTYRRDR